MKKILSIISVFLLTISFAYSQSQYIDNALKFSQNDYGGTARFVGMGGAFGALGGDFSSTSINPAGLGLYRSSELVFSPGLSYNANSSSYLGNSTDENGYSMNLGNLGFVASYSLEESDTRWVNFNFGVGFNRINDLNNNIRFSGINDNTRLETFVDKANSEGLYDMYEEVLWNAYVLNYDTVLNEYYTHITDEVINDPANFEVFQQKVIENEGSISEFNFTFSGNYAHKLYIGASIGIMRLRYEQYASLYEFETSNLDFFETNGYEFREYSKTEGTGFTLKFGAIYKPVDFVRIGASLHLPTFYDLDQEFHNKAVGYFETESHAAASSPVQDYEYEVNTPLRAMFALGFQVSKFALIDIDYEYADYSTMKLDDEFNEIGGVIQDNDDIQNLFQETHNLRAGAEFRYGPLYFRAGGRYSTSPYKNISDYDQFSFAGGFGYREKNFFVDFAFSQTISNYNMYAYIYEYNSAVADIDYKLNKFILSFGFKF